MKALFATLALGIMTVTAVPSINSVEANLSNMRGGGFTGDPYTDCWLECRGTGDNSRDYQVCFDSCIRRKLGR